MKTALHGTTGLSGADPGRQIRTTRRIKGMAAILMALVFPCTGDVRGQTPGGPYQVKLSWNPSSSPDVTGYRIHYGTMSATYTASVVVGSMTSGTVSGLLEGLTYHFAVSAINEAGLESGLSNEVIFKPGFHSSQIRSTANGQAILVLYGLIGSEYDIEASEDLKTWNLIHSTTMPERGLLEFSDPDAGRHPTRFYRTRQRP